MKKIIYLLMLICSCVTVILSSKTAYASEETVIEAFAHYEFDDENNLGKDSSKHGFHLIDASTSADKNAMKYLFDETDNDGYISIRRDQKDDGVSKNSGAYLYAPQQGDSNFDFSDMITGSYTFSMKFKCDNSIPYGDGYVISFGRYMSCFTIVPWNNGIEIQLNNVTYSDGKSYDEKYSNCASSTYFVSYSTNDWIDLTVTADTDDNVLCVYINGSLINSFSVSGVKLTSSDYDNYTFSIGAQCTIFGTGAAQFGNVDVKDIQIYDCALSEKNVNNIVNGKNAILEQQYAGEIYVIGVEKLDTSKLDLEITDVNSIDALLSGSLPSKVKVSLSNNVVRSYPAYWYIGEDGTIRAYVQTGFINPSLSEIVLDYKYVAKFEYDEDLVTIYDIKLDGEDYVPGTEITPSKHMVSFKVSVPDGVSVDSVSYYGMDWIAEDDGTYFVDIVEGGLISIDAGKQTFTVTYMDGTEKLSTSKYTEGGNEQLKTFTKDGYTFEGWYLDASFSEEFTGLDYANPTNITLYSKWKSVATGDTTSDGNNTIIFVIIGIAGAIVLTGSVVAFLVIKKRKKK